MYNPRMLAVIANANEWFAGRKTVALAVRNYTAKYLQHTNTLTK